MKKKRENIARCPDGHVAEVEEVDVPWQTAYRVSCHPTDNICWCGVTRETREDAISSWNNVVGEVTNRP